MTDYEQGFRDGVERAALKVCIQCQQGYPLENREIPTPDHSSKVYPCHQSPDGTWIVCGAADIRALTPGVWKQFVLAPESMAAMFHETYVRLAPKFRYATRHPQGWKTQSDRYRAALARIVTQSKDKDMVDEAMQALADGQKLPLRHRRQPLQPIAPWDRASGRHRGLTIAVCEEMLSKFGSKDQAV